MYKVGAHTREASFLWSEEQGQEEYKPSNSSRLFSIAAVEPGPDPNHDSNVVQLKVEAVDSKAAAEWHPNTDVSLRLTQYPSPLRDRQGQ